MTRLAVQSDAEAVALAAAQAIQESLYRARGSRGCAHIALAGGSTPARTYELLAAGIADWSGIHLWFGDERAVPPDSPQSNYRMVKEMLLDRTSIPTDQVHAVAGECQPDEAAAAYESELRAQLPAGGAGPPALDVALMGIGEDAHTASLFPDYPALEVKDRLCVVVHDSPKPPPTRLTLTVPMFRRARQTIFLIAGEAKREAIAAMLQGPDFRYPASLLTGDHTDLFADRAAAGGGLASGNFSP